MNIFEYAKEFDADYYDPATGYIYKIADYNRARRLGFPITKIAVEDSATGKIIGYVSQET